MEAWKACKIFADNLIATEYPSKYPCLKTWYRYSYTKTIKLLKIDICQWLSLIFNDFSRQNAIFPGQHQIQWLFKASLKFHDFSRLVWTMVVYRCVESSGKHYHYDQELLSYRKWQDYVYIQCEYKSTKQKIKHLLREENKVKENKIS